MRSTLTKMRYTLTFIESGRTERIPERLNDLFFDAIFTATGLFRSKAEMLLEAGPIETTTHIFRRFRWSKVKPIAA